MELVADKFLLSIVNKHLCICLLCVAPLIIYLLLLVIIKQYIVKIELVTEMLIPNYQSLFFQINSISLIESEEFRETFVVVGFKHSGITFIRDIQE